MNHVVQYLVRCALAATLLVACDSAKSAAASIGINIHGGAYLNPANGASVTGAAGAPGFVQSNWNNIGTDAFFPNGTKLNLRDSNGAATATDVTWAGSSYFDTHIDVVTQDDRLMLGYIDSEPAFGPAVFTVSSIPYASYRVVVYFDGENRAENQVSLFTIGNQTIAGRDASRTNFNGTYYQIPNSSTTDRGLNTPVGNFVVFEPIGGDSFRLEIWAGSTTGANRRGRLNALQVVAVPEPASWTMALLGVMGLLAWRLQIRRRQAAGAMAAHSTA